MALARRLEGGEDPATALDEVRNDAADRVRQWFEKPSSAEIHEVITLAFAAGLSERVFEMMLGRLITAIADAGYTLDADAAGQAEPVRAPKLLRPARADRGRAEGLISRETVIIDGGTVTVVNFRDAGYRHAVLATLCGSYSATLWDVVRVWLKDVVSNGQGRNAAAAQITVAEGLAVLAHVDMNEVEESYLDPWATGSIGSVGQLVAAYALWYMCFDDDLAPTALHIATKWATTGDAARRWTAAITFSGELGLRYPTQAANRLWHLIVQSKDSTEARFALARLFATMTADGQSAGRVLALLDQRLDDLSRGRRDPRQQGLIMLTALTVLAVRDGRTGLPSITLFLRANPGRLVLAWLPAQLRPALPALAAQRARGADRRGLRVRQRQRRSRTRCPCARECARREPAARGARTTRHRPPEPPGPRQAQASRRRRDHARAAGRPGPPEQHRPRGAGMNQPYPIISQTQLKEAERRGLWKMRGPSRAEAEIPRLNPHEVRVFRVDGHFVVDDGRHKRDDNRVVNATSVSVVNMRRGADVAASFEIDSQDAAKFTVQVNFTCSVIDPITVVRDGQHDASDSLLAYLKGYQPLFELGLKHSLTDINTVRREAGMHVKAYMMMSPPQIPGMAITLANVQVMTPVELAEYEKRRRSAAQERGLEADRMLGEQTRKKYEQEGEWVLKEREQLATHAYKEREQEAEQGLGLRQQESDHLAKLKQQEHDHLAGLARPSVSDRGRHGPGRGRGRRAPPGAPAGSRARRTDRGRVRAATSRAG